MHGLGCGQSGPGIEALAVRRIAVEAEASLIINTDEEEKARQPVKAVQVKGDYKIANQADARSLCSNLRRM